MRQIEEWVLLSKSSDPDTSAECKRLLREVATAATAKQLAPIGASTGGSKAAESKKETASIGRDRAIARFKELIASGDRDAPDAMGIMETEGWSKRSLQRHLANELARLGRGRRKPVK